MDHTFWVDLQLVLGMTTRTVVTGQQLLRLKRGQSSC